MNVRTTEHEAHRLPVGDTERATFIVRIVSALLSDSAQARRTPRPEVLQMLIRAVRSGDADMMAALTGEIRTQQIPSDVLVDTYLPEAANALGQMWHNDTLDILSATIAFARLQTLLRTASETWRADDIHGSGGSILMLSPEDEQHTLGALVATSQFRRMGVSVTVFLLASEQRALSEAMQGHFDAICISIGNTMGLESTTKLVKSLRSLRKPCPPIIVGGSVPQDARTIEQITGADLATTSVTDALAYLGLDRDYKKKI